MKKFLQKFAVLVILSAMPLMAYAENLILKSSKTNYGVGDSFQVALSVNTEGKSINTISGQIQLPTSKLQILGVRYGSSIISLWVSRPKINSSAGTITFTGGTPGGFSGPNGPVLSFSVKAKAAGEASIGLSEVKILLNDGLGTEMPATAGVLKLSIAPALPKSPAGSKLPENPAASYAPPPDTVPPENFIPLISSSPSIAGGKYFVSFNAVDKDSGIDHYEIKEEPWILSYFTSRFNSDFTRQESPYVLGGQYWAYKVIVRAYDQAGNHTDAFAEKPMSQSAEAGFVLLLLLFSIFATYEFSRPRPRKRKII